VRIAHDKRPSPNTSACAPTRLSTNPQAWTSDRPRQSRPRPPRAPHPQQANAKNDKGRQDHQQPPPAQDTTRNTQEDPRRPTPPGTRTLRNAKTTQTPRTPQAKTTKNPPNHQPQPPTEPTDKPKNHPLVTAGSAIRRGENSSDGGGFSGIPPGEGCRGKARAGRRRARASDSSPTSLSSLQSGQFWCIDGLRRLRALRVREATALQSADRRLSLQPLDVLYRW